MPLDSTPVLIGQGQITQKGVPFAAAQSPMGLMVEAAKRAEADTGVKGLLAGTDLVAIVRMIVDSSRGTKFPIGKYHNPPGLLAKKLGIAPREEIYSSVGGNTPQMLVNQYAERIAKGEIKMALIAAGEALETMTAALKAGQPPQWGDGPEGGEGLKDPIDLGYGKDGESAYERAHNMHLPTNVYPLIESAIRGARGRGIAEHQLAMGKLFAGFTQVAAKNPHAWFPVARTAEEIALPGDKNRYVGFPYPKFLNSMIFVDMAAAVIMTSYGEAKRLGVPEDKLIYLHGCADANEIWNVSERESLHTSPAIRAIAKDAYGMAGIGPKELGHIDLYSCFPSAVEIGAAEFGLAEDDPRGLTVTGGLCYFGGPGNNYVLHSIASMMERLRADRGSYGLVTANGWYVTKHSAGIYSTKPVEGAWTRVAPAATQAEADKAPKAKLTVEANGKGTIETYTVIHTHSGPSIGIIVGRLADGSRFLANTPREDGLFARMVSEEMLGKTGTVSHQEGKNLFTPD